MKTNNYLSNNYHANMVVHRMLCMPEIVAVILMYVPALNFVRKYSTFVKIECSKSRHDIISGITYYIKIRNLE